MNSLTLPKSQIELQSLIQSGNHRYRLCIECHHQFTTRNVWTEDGWRETQISGLCEACFDELCRRA